MFLNCGLGGYNDGDLLGASVEVRMVIGGCHHWIIGRLKFQQVLVKNVLHRRFWELVRSESLTLVFLFFPKPCFPL